MNKLIFAIRTAIQILRSNQSTAMIIAQGIACKNILSKQENLYMRCPNCGEWFMMTWNRENILSELIKNKPTSVSNIEICHNECGHKTLVSIARDIPQWIVQESYKSRTNR